MKSLIKQAIDIASFIRYYNPEMRVYGHFDDFLDEIKRIGDMPNPPEFDGNMEPSQAILYTFLYNLQEIRQNFFQKWKKQYVPWYINQILNVQSKPLASDSTWISFQSGVTENLYIKKGTRFTCSEALTEDKVYYRLTEDTEVNPIQVVKAYLLHLEKNEAIFPANLFDFPIALHKKNYYVETNAEPSENNPQSVGMQLTSPSLLLESGKRKVALSMQTEKYMPLTFGQKRKIVRLFQLKKEQEPYLSQKEIRTNSYINLLSSLFYLEISTEKGWENIENYTVNLDDGNLNIQFLLEENFPPTVACNSETHKITAEYPGLKIMLNHNAWLYPYAWLRNFYIEKIIINTKVENMGNLLFYNDLGLVDTSKPFPPFGINTEQGAWFVIGNYEIAKKNLRSIGVKIEWQQLPAQENGLHDYYSNYHEDINNHSFKIRPEYLADYKWHNTENAAPFYLFSTLIKENNGQPEALGKLINETLWQDIRIKELPPIRTKKENYEYSAQTKNGFFRFTLDEPGMGLGEKHYRQLYTRLLMSKDFRQGKEIKLNEPLNPLVNRITLSYEASDKIDLRTYPQTEENRLYHIHPLGEQQIYPKQDNRPLPFVYGLNYDYTVLFGLQNVKGDETLNLYFEFQPIKEEVSLSSLPAIAWYWGDGYHWERLPDETILRNTTQNLLTNGFLKLYIPSVPEKNFRDADGLLWIAAGIEKNGQYAAPLLKLHTNVAKVTKDPAQLEKKRPEKFFLNESEKEIPGVTNITQVATFGQGQDPEIEKEKFRRISEYVSHRHRAVTARDYERITLQVFPEIKKVKCLYDVEKKKVLLVVIPVLAEEELYERPCAQPELLLNVEKYFRKYTSPFVRSIDAIHPVYEEIIVRCEVTLTWTNYSNAASRAMLTKVMNLLIAPWQNTNEPPSFGYSFTMQEMYDKLVKLNQVEEMKQFSIIHIYRDKAGKYLYKEYTDLHDVVKPSVPYALLVPARKHLFISKQEHYGLEEMNINDNFII